MHAHAHRTLTGSRYTYIFPNSRRFFTRAHPFPKQQQYPIILYHNVHLVDRRTRVETLRRLIMTFKLYYYETSVSILFLPRFIYRHGARFHDRLLIVRNLRGIFTAPGLASRYDETTSPCYRIHPHMVFSSVTTIVQCLLYVQAF